MHEIAKDLHFSYGHRLMNHAGKCKMLHGHNARVTIRLGAAKLDENGMLVDFGDLKNKAKLWIDEQFDHQMLLHKDDPVAAVLKKAGEHVRLLEVHPTAESLAQLIFEFISKSGFPVIEVVLWETESCQASYRKV